MFQYRVLLTTRGFNSIKYIDNSLDENLYLVSIRTNSYLSRNKSKKDYILALWI